LSTDSILFDIFDANKEKSIIHDRFFSSDFAVQSHKSFEIYHNKHFSQLYLIL